MFGPIGAEKCISAHEYNTVVNIYGRKLTLVASKTHECAFKACICDYSKLLNFTCVLISSTIEFSFRQIENIEFLVLSRKISQNLKGHYNQILFNDVKKWN